MGGYTKLKAAIAAAIKANRNNEITGAIMQVVLNTIVSTVGANRTFVGIANENTNPGTPDSNVFYIAYKAGNYVNFQSEASNLTVKPGELAILYNGTNNWDKFVIGMSSDGVIALANTINQINATGRYAYTDTDIVKGSNTGSQKVRTFLVAGQPYRFTLTPVGDSVSVDIQGIKADGTFDVIGSMISTPAGTTKTITPTKNYYGFTIFYGSKTIATSANVLFETPTTGGMGLPDVVYVDAVNGDDTNPGTTEGAALATFAAAIKANRNNEITGAIMQVVLNTIVSTVGANRTFVGIANENTNPGTPDSNVFYIAYKAGNYVNFQSEASNLTVKPGELAILYNGTNNWDKFVIGMSSDGVIALANTINQINATGRYAYTDTDIVKGSNTGSQKVRTFLVAGQPYRFTLTPVGDSVSVDIQGIKADGTFDVIGSMISTPAGTTKTITPTKNYYGFTIFYGSKTIATSANVLFETPTTGGMGLPDVVYVDAVNGDDTNPGTTEGAALATFAAAFSKTGVDTTIILIGDTTERLNIKTKSNQRSVRLIGKRGLVNRIICGTKIDSGTLVAGTTNVYQTPLSSFSTAARFQLFQHEVFDESTLIPDNERHPLQRGKTYRCDSTKITRVTSLDAVKTSKGYTFFYDTDAQMLYVKIKEGTTLAANPVYIPGGSGIFGNDGSVAFEMVNIECWYGSILLRSCHGGRAIDCAAKYALGDGAWSWDAAIGVELIRCEAARAFSGLQTGNGFNANSTTTDPALAKHTAATMIDCWGHDNNDNGYSDHERCETTIIGGLFEYNVGGGIKPSWGSHDTIYNAYCRKQVDSGITLVKSAKAEEGGRGSQIFAIGCICENNKNNYYVSGDKYGADENFGRFVNCVSLNADCGYLCGTNARIELNNCTDSGSSTAKSGNVIVNNAALVE